MSGTTWSRELLVLQLGLDSHITLSGLCSWIIKLSIFINWQRSRNPSQFSQRNTSRQLRYMMQRPDRTYTGRLFSDFSVFTYGHCLFVLPWYGYLMAEIRLPLSPFWHMLEHTVAC